MQPTKSSLEVSRLVPLVAFLLISSWSVVSGWWRHLCLWTHVRACAAESGLLLSVLEKSASWSNPPQGFLSQIFLHRDNCNLSVPKLLPSLDQRRQGTNRTALQTLTLCLSTERRCTAAPRQGELPAPAPLSAVHSWHCVYLRQKPPRNASVVRHLHLAFLLWASSWWLKIITPRGNSKQPSWCCFSSLTVSPSCFFQRRLGSSAVISLVN